MEIRFHKEESLKGSLMIIGFPSRGLVGGVAANFVIEELKMWHIAALYDPRLPPTIVVRKGVAFSPIQFYVSAERCGPDGSCDKLVACLSEIPLDQSLLGDVAWKIVDWAKQQGVKHVVILEGMETVRAPAEKAKRAKPQVHGVRSNTSKLDLKKLGVATVEEGVVSSYGSSFLLAANHLGVDLTALYIEAAAEIPDAFAAAKLLRSVDPMLPHIDFETGALEARAKVLEKGMKTAIKSSQKQLSNMRKAGEMMYA